MAPFSPEGKEDGVTELLVALPRPPRVGPLEFTQVSEQHDGDDLLKRALEEVASLRQRNAELEEKLKDFEFKVEVRQLFNDFRHSPHGYSILRKLMDQARIAFPSDFGWSSWDSFLQKDITSFSVMVIELVNLKINLQKENEDRRSSEVERRIAIINKKLACLEAAAKDFQTSDMLWDQTIGKGVYACCLLVADVNKACHRDMTEEFLQHMFKYAGRWECKYEDVQMGPALKAIIRDIRLQNASPSSGLPCRVPLVSSSSRVT